MYIYRFFPPGGNGGESPATSQNSPLPTKFLSPTTSKQQFSSYNTIKTAFLAVVIAPVPFLF